MTIRTMGVDLGSTTGKAVIIDESGAIVAHKVVQMGAVSRRGVTAAIAAVLEEAIWGVRNSTGSSQPGTAVG